MGKKLREITDTPDSCPLGYICHDGEGVRCDVLQNLWRSNIGPLLDGIYCPEGSETIENCECGYYCPDPHNKVICPQGYFCPHKTQKPEIICIQCEEGADRLQRSGYGYTLLGLLGLGLVVYSIKKAVQQYWSNNEDKRQKLIENQVCKQREVEMRKRMRERMHKLGPKLKAIYGRVGLKYEEPTPDSVYFRCERCPFRAAKQKANFKKANQGLDMAELFDAIDTDSDGDLSFSELNKALQLKPAQLKEFVLEMNTQAGEPLDNTEVSKAVFVEYFLETMEQAAQYDPSPEDASLLFDELAKAQGIDLSENNYAMVELSGLYDTHLTLFLSLSQLNRIVKTLGKIKQDSESTITKQRSRKHLIQRSLSRNISLRNTGSEELGDTVRYGTNRAKVDKGTFIDHYPFAFYMATEGADDDIPEGVDITFENLSLNVTVAGHTTPVVNSVTGRLKKKSMTALMGGSGAGKTSLLNALCGRAFYGDVTGNVLINGHEASIEKYMDVIGFVPQDDIVYAELTVKENLVFAGKFQLPHGTNINYIEDLADETMAHLGLTRVADNLVGDVTRRGVSGGEKKRVNIGLELMSKPAILFLDEPTSGLDSSSAMLVMGGLRTLVEKQGVTICSVIHQPRKFIFELFDSLILLGVGGNLVYHGAVDNALQYFEDLHFHLPAGESVADWLIDISSGSLTPQTVYIQKTQAITMHAKEKANRFKKNDTNDSTKINRSNLYRQWKDHFRLIDKKEKKNFDPPKPFELPHHTKKQPFRRQLWFHIQRNLLVARRNRANKNNDTMLLLAAVVIVCMMDGILELTVDKNPEINYEYEVMTTPSKAKLQIEKIGEQLFAYAAGGFVKIKQHALKLGVIIPVLLGLSASKVLTEKRLELFRESASGYNLNAYYLAVNITATVEHMIQTLLCAVIAIWLRGSIVDYTSSLLNYLMLGWISMSWGLFLPIVVPPKSVVLVISFFMVFFGLLCSGGFPPMEYEQLYNKENRFLGLLAGFLSPSRFFLETQIVQESRCLPPQSGFTLNEENAPGFEFEYNSFNTQDLAGYSMPGVSNQSYKGWYWGVLPAFFVGLTIRFAGAISLHAFNRSLQSKGTFMEEFRTNSGFRIMITFLFLCFGASAAAAAVLMNSNWI